MSAPFFDQFTPDQMRAAYRRNAKQLREMHAKALKAGKRVNGYTAEELDRFSKQAEAKGNQCVS